MDTIYKDSEATDLMDGWWTLIRLNDVSIRRLSIKEAASASFYPVTIAHQSKHPTVPVSVVNYLASLEQDAEVKGKSKYILPLSRKTSPFLFSFPR